MGTDFSHVQGIPELVGLMTLSCLSVRILGMQTDRTARREEPVWDLETDFPGLLPTKIFQGRTLWAILPRLRFSLRKLAVQRLRHTAYSQSSYIQISQFKSKGLKSQSCGLIPLLFHPSE